MTKNTYAWCGLIASVLMGLGAQSHELPDDWRHIIGVLSIVGTAIHGWLIQQRPKDDDMTVRRHR
jgi:hypothetical protein